MTHKNDFDVETECYTISLVYPGLKGTNVDDYMAVARNVRTSVEFSVGDGQYNNVWFVRVRNII